MRSVFFSAAMLLMSPITQAATPIDGWYSSLFVGYAYLPDNVNTTHLGNTYSNMNYQPGYLAGGSLGYKSNPLRYEAELTYLNATIDQFSMNLIPQTQSSGYNNGVLGMANVYYDFQGLIPCLQPYLGFGIGYAWINIPIHNLSPTAPPNFKITTSAFAYQGMIGVTYNFSESYAANIGYQYLATPRVFDLGHTFQASLAKVGLTYRFDNAKYK
jgi:opacity protein-like surface antigen